MALKDLAQFIRDPRHLWVGKPVQQFGKLRPRELVGNWLLCVALSHGRGESLTFTTDHAEGDGVIVDKTSGATFPTEHVFVPKQQPGEHRSVEEQVIDQVTLKQEKAGAQYARGRMLLVFLESGGGQWFPNRASRALPHVDFDAVFVVGLQEFNERLGEFVYGVTEITGRLISVPTWDIRWVITGDRPMVEARLRGLAMGVPIWNVHVSKHFDGWRVERMQ